jgi:two-component system, sensor histidine kinase and response regulator
MCWQTSAFIFTGLFLIKKENTDYQKEMLYSNWELNNTNEEIKKQRLQLEEKALLLEEQTLQLVELNTVKDRLFSVISHDLKTPIYSLRNLFKGMHENNLPAAEIKLYVPEILTDLNYTIGLMENLLQWAKSQMQGDNINQQLIDVGDLMDDVKHLLRLQAQNKKIYVNTKADKPLYIYADKDMMNLVLLNLLSNAIKFTPENGEVSLSALVKDETVEVHVQDTGKGISSDNIQKLFNNNYFTTKGTANESGTGLGLMLCKEFLNKNGGKIFVESEEGKGSRFSFTIPKA